MPRCGARRMKTNPPRGFLFPRKHASAVLCFLCRNASVLGQFELILVDTMRWYLVTPSKIFIYKPEKAFSPSFCDEESSSVISEEIGGLLGISFSDRRQWRDRPQFRCGSEYGGIVRASLLLYLCLGDHNHTACSDLPNTPLLTGGLNHGQANEQGSSDLRRVPPYAHCTAAPRSLHARYPWR